MLCVQLEDGTTLPIQPYDPSKAGGFVPVAHLPIVAAANAASAPRRSDLPIGERLDLVLGAAPGTMVGDFRHPLNR